MNVRCGRRGLIKSALARRFTRPPPEKLRTVTKTSAGSMIETNLDHESRPHRQSPLRSVLYRLEPPGALPVNPGADP
jgi:hypothetical protein